MSTATVHRRKLATTGAVPSGASAAKPRSRSRRPSIIGDPRSTVPVRSQGAEQPTRARPRRFPAPAPRCRGQLRARSGHPRADRARRAPHAHTFVARLPRLRLEPSGVLRAEARGLLPMMRAHQGLRLAIFGVAAALVLLLVALLVYWWLLPAPAARRLPLRHRRCRRGPEHGRGPVGAGHGALPVPERRLLGRRPLRPGHVGFHRGCSVALAMAYVAATVTPSTPPSRSPNGPPITT